jgi:hypothetical protein
MNRDDWLTQTPEEARLRRLGRRCYDNHGRSIVNQDDPPEDEDDDDATDTDPEKTPIVNDPEDPGEHLEPHQPELGGEGG